MKNLIIFSLLLSFCVAASGQNTSGYHLIDTIQVGGEGGWDALTADAANHRLYVSHGTHVVVINTETDKVVGDIPKTNGVHGIALTKKSGFITNGRDNTVTMFDLKTLKVAGVIPTDKNPDIIIYDPSSNRVFSFNGGSNNATVIDPDAGKAVGTIALGGKPEFAVSDGKGKIFVNLEDRSEIVGFDAKKLTILSHFPLAPGEGPTGLAIDTKTHRLFAACDKKMIVVDAKTGKVVGEVTTGDGTDGAEFDPGTKMAFAPNGEGTLTVIREDAADKFSIAENVTTQVRARTMALDTKTHKVYLPTAKFGTAPAPTKEQPRPRAPMVPDSFVILVYGR
jgi:DNA-binding beta-propeller fold protein YncE